MSLFVSSGDGQLRSKLGCQEKKCVENESCFFKWRYIFNTVSDCKLFWDCCLFPGSSKWPWTSALWQSFLIYTFKVEKIWNCCRDDLTPSFLFRQNVTDWLLGRWHFCICFCATFLMPFVDWGIRPHFWRFRHRLDLGLPSIQGHC